MTPRVDSRSICGLEPPRARPRFPGPTAGVAAHYNGPPMGMLGKPHAECRRRWRGVQRYHIERNGWADVAYTAAPCHHGVVMLGRGPGVRTAANGTRQGNDRYYALFFLLGGEEEPTAEQLYAAAWYAREHLGTEAWVGHGELKPTACPGAPLRQRVRDGRLIVPVPAGEEDEMVIRRGAKGPAVKAFQQALVNEAQASGRAGGDPLPKFGVDGGFGEETEGAVRAYQRGAQLPEATGVIDGVTAALLARYIVPSR